MMTDWDIDETNPEGSTRLGINKSTLPSRLVLHSYDLLNAYIFYIYHIKFTDTRFGLPYFLARLMFMQEDTSVAWFFLCVVIICYLLKLLCIIFFGLTMPIFALTRELVVILLCFHFCSLHSFPEEGACVVPSRVRLLSPSQHFTYHPANPVAPLN